MMPNSDHADHEIEPELQRPAPRRIKRRAGHPNVGGCVQIFLLPHTLVGLFLPLYLLFLLCLATFGIDSPGHVLSTNSYMSTGKSPHMVYDVRYSFKVNGIEHTNETSVPADKFGELHEGSPVTARYLAGMPDTHPVLTGPGFAPYSELGFVIIFTIFWDMFVGFVAWTVYVVPVVNRNLVVSGVPAVGRVVDKKMNIGSKTTSCVVTYEFVPERVGIQQASPITGKTTVTSADYSLVREGEPVTILYKRDQPKTNLLYKGAEFEAVG